MFFLFVIIIIIYILTTKKSFEIINKCCHYTPHYVNLFL
ncbi:hypothetical protein A0H76_3018 [Hepatospora eriocheir]|uniref:Uncharacterized protein n=1 Tax=Hepatospora eriocheir TaxID=1081669 RepID=A0A1X0QJ29_9MICR|nr:hypothetical protein A0H76_3018 [Hepatospora eriocheir]